MKTKTYLASLLLLTFALGSPAEEPLLIERTQITVNVLGAVNKPSRVTLPIGATILDALASAGSATTEGNLSRVKIIHKSAPAKPNVSEINVKQILNGTSENVALRDGDTINVTKILYAMP